MNILANATGATKQLPTGTKINTSKPQSIIGKLSAFENKPYNPIKCQMFLLPKFYLPDIETAAGYRNNSVEAIMNLFYKYPSLDYFSAYGFSTQNNQVNKDVWKKFLDLYDQGYIKRIYDKINGYFEGGLQNYVKNNTDENYFKAGARDGQFLYQKITEEITVRIGFESSSEKQEILWQLIYDFIYTPEALFEAIYKNAKQFLINEAKKLNPSISGISDDPATSNYKTANGSLDMLSTRYGKIGSVMDFALTFNKSIYTQAKENNKKLTLYTIALKDNLTQLQVSTKAISNSENEDGRQNGDYPGGEDENAGGRGNDVKNSDKTMLLLGIGVLVIIFILERFKR